VRVSSRRAWIRERFIWLVHFRFAADEFSLIKLPRQLNFTEARDAPWQRSSGSEPGASHSTGHKGVPEIPLKSVAPATEKHYLGIRYDPGMFSSRVARTAPFALASLLK
jgi:hypothetical protein